MSGRPPSLGLGLYFIDVLACLLFSLGLALATARFSRELSVPVDLPRVSERPAPGALPAVSITLRARPEGPALHLDGEPLSFAALEARLRDAPPPAVRVRAEESALARVVAIAHAAGVFDIQLAYVAGPVPGGGS